MVGLRPDPNKDEAELGYYVDRQHWGLGIATEAARSVVHHGIHVLGLRRITSGYLLDTPESGRVLSKFGSFHTGYAERPYLAAGASC